MKTNILSFTVLTTLLAVGCSKTEVQPQTWMTDPDAVIVDASVGAVTKSNPLGNESEQQKFNAGDEITVIQPKVGASVVYKFDGTSWSPSGGDYLVWSDKGKTFEAWYPAKDPSFVTDQSTVEGIAKADVMSCRTDYLTIPSDHRLELDLYRQRALVAVKIKGYNDEFDPAKDKITDMSIYLTDAAENSDQAVKPYVRDASGAAQASDAAGTVGFSYSAIGLRASGSDVNLFIEFKVGEKTMTVKGCPALEAGKAYTFNLTVGKARIDAGDVTVADWSDPVDINDGNEFEADVDGEVWDGSIATSFESGTGTEADPYIIATPSQLAYLAQEVNSYYSSKYGSIYAFEGKYFRQTKDFVLADKLWTPIGCDYSYGSSYSGTRYFAGHYDGNGKKVYGLNVVKKDKAFSGLFGAVSKGSIANCTVFGSVDASSCAGGIVGCMVGGATMTNCAVEVTVKGTTWVGGLCGSLNSASVSDCSVVNCSVEGVQYVGCLVGSISGSDGSAALKDCSASGIVTGAQYIGGVVGYVGQSIAPMEISDCTVNADLTVLASVTTTGKWGQTYKGTTCGGLAGRVTYKSEDKPESAKFSGCGFNGTITKGGKDVENVGAAIGWDESAATFTDCWYNADKIGDLPLVAKIEDDAVGKEYTGIEAKHLGN